MQSKAWGRVREGEGRQCNACIDCSQTNTKSRSRRLVNASMPTMLADERRAAAISSTESCTPRIPRNPSLTTNACAREARAGVMCGVSDERWPTLGFGVASVAVGRTNHRGASELCRTNEPSYREASPRVDCGCSHREARSAAHRPSVALNAARRTPPRPSNARNHKTHCD